jgi:hypothetical protein
VCVCYMGLEFDGCFVTGTTMFNWQVIKECTSLVA